MNDDTEKNEEFEKWKTDTIEDVNEIIVTDNMAFDEYLNSLFDFAFLKGKTVGLNGTVDKLKKLKDIMQ